MNINQIKKSKFLTRADVNPPALMTVQGVEEVNVAMEGAPPEIRFACYFNESEKPMVLNSTNAKIMAGVFASEETDEWTGKKIVLYDDPNISFGGKLVGGIRCRAPKVKQPGATPAPAPAKPAPAPLPAEPEGDVPF